MYVARPGCFALVDPFQTGYALNPLYLVVGAVLLAALVVDILWTTLWVEEGAGPLTSKLMAVTWRAMRPLGTHEPRALTVAGPVILVGSLATWIALLWGGWTFVLAGLEAALVDTQAGGPISWVDRAYFTGYTIFTLGNGDFAPTTGLPQIATVLASASGLLFITLGVTYVLSVLDAVTQKRSFASDIDGLGSDGTGIVLAAWTGEGFEGLEVSLNALSSELNTLTSNHKAYPVLHYFYSRRAEQAPPSRVAVLDEALTLLRFGVPEEHRPPDLVLRPAHASVENYLATLEETFVTSADRTPDPPGLARLEDAGVPVVPESAFRESLEPLERRRRILLALVESDRREWPAGDD